MDPLKHKRILLIITGSIAAYKSALLTRALIKKGAEVKVVMTEAATHFISPLTISTLARNEALVEMMQENQWNSHVDMGLWADIVLVAPATANTIAKMAHGLADNLALTTYLSAKCPTAVAPAMDLDMWKHPATQNNIDTLKGYGNLIIPVASGELASGLRGEGRMAEPEAIIAWLEDFFSKKKVRQDLKGKKILITGGPTYEAIDPVRFIGNHSSGKMGLALAKVCSSRGADVRLVLGPNSLEIPGNFIVDKVVSAAEMAQAVFHQVDEMDVIILAAAVADYSPAEKSSTKIKKKEGPLKIELERTTDIAATIGKNKKEGQILVGFALETNNAIENATRKLHKKNFDFIVLNSLEDKGAGFKHDTNKISIIARDNKIKHFELKSKDETAKDIVDHIVHIKSTLK